MLHIGAGNAKEQLAALRGEMEQSLQLAASVVRTGKTLQSEIEHIRHLLTAVTALTGVTDEDTFSRLRLENDLHTALLLLLSAAERTETVGCHVREDYPERENSRYRVLVTKQDGSIKVEREDWTKQSEEA